MDNAACVSGWEASFKNKPNLIEQYFTDTYVPDYVGFLSHKNHCYQQPKDLQFY